MTDSRSLPHLRRCISGCTRDVSKRFFDSLNRPTPLLMPSSLHHPSSLLHSATMAVNDDKELVALVTWLQTFEVFSHRIVDGQNGKVALDTVLDALNNPATTRCVFREATF